MNFIVKAIRQWRSAPAQAVEARERRLSRRDVLMLVARNRLTPAQARALMQKR